MFSYVAGWKRYNAEEHLIKFAPMFEIGNETDFNLQKKKNRKYLSLKNKKCSTNYHLSI